MTDSESPKPADNAGNADKASDTDKAHAVNSPEGAGSADAANAAKAERTARTEPSAQGAKAAQGVPSASSATAAAAAAAPLRRKRESRKQERRRQLIGAGVIGAVVVVVLAIAVGFTFWQQKKDKVDPSEVTISVKDASGHKTEVKPYQACALGDNCSEGETTKIDLPADGEATITLPNSVYKNQWSLLTIYDDDAKSDQSVYDGGSTSTATIKGSKDGSRLTVAEIHTVMVGNKDGDDENAYTMVWAIAPK